MLETALYQWEEGQRRLHSAPPREQPALEHVVAKIVEELRRRLGGSFTTAELTELYERGTDWALDLAMATAPEAPHAWESQTVVDAAFARYVRGASDFAGGRVIEQ